MKKAGFFALTIGCFMLSACGEDDLSRCVASTEQTIMLRQMTLVGQEKVGFERCLEKTTYGRDYCKALWLNADTAVMSCMERQGYTFTNTESGFGLCGYSDWENPECYRSKWILMLPDEIRSRFFKT
jgi:hypothetical protein